MEVSSKSRRKTFTVPQASASVCDRTFVRGEADAGVQGRGVGDLHTSRVEKRPPFSESFANMSCASSSLLPAAASQGQGHHQRHRPTGVFPSSQPPSQTAGMTSLPATSFMSRDNFKSFDPTLEKMISNLCVERQPNLRKLNGLVREAGVSLVMNETCSSDPLFETTTVEPTSTKKKPGLALEQLRIKEKTLLDEINRINSTTMIKEDQHKSVMMDIEKKMERMGNKLDAAKKRQRELKAEKVTIANQYDQTLPQVQEVQFVVDLKNEFLQKFIKVDSNFKCKDYRFCQEFHKDGCCFEKPTT